nr:hypothetical protein [uncultured Albidiferax sp.]
MNDVQFAQIENENILSNNAIGVALEAYRNPYFLKSTYGASTLVAEYGEELRDEISFDISLDDGSSLASAENWTLRSEIYDLICIQAIPHRGRRNPGPGTVRQRVLKMLHIVNYFLINHGASIRKYGFKSITGNELIALIRTISASNDIVDQLDSWNYRLSRFLIEGGNSLSNADYFAAIEKEPTIEEITFDIDESSLGLTVEQVKRARAFLFTAGFYNKQRRDGVFIPNGAAVYRFIYRDILSTGMPPSKRYAEELTIRERGETQREFEGVSVRTGYDDPRCSPKALSNFTSILFTAKRLSNIGIGLPLDSIALAESYDPSRTISFKSDGHTKPVPVEHILFSLKNAIEYFYEHAEHLLDSHVKVLVAAKRAGLQPAILDAEYGITSHLRPETAQYGVTAWSLVKATGRVPNAVRTPDFHGALRKGKTALCELVKVAFGSMLTITGIFSAGRQGELSDLAKLSFDEANRWIELDSRKSGYGRVRRQHPRPVPKLVIDVLKLLRDYKDKLQFNGIEVPRELFAVPSFHAYFRIDTTAISAALDLFADFIEMPLDDEGRRYYLRQHQLRQFFILAFFHAGGVGGFDTIRWFVRHDDPAHLWAYLRQNVSGEIMMRLKAIAVKALLANDAPEVSELLSFLKIRLGVARLDIMTDQELQLYLEDLQENGTVEIEPLFYTDGGSKTWRMGVKVFGET